MKFFKRETSETNTVENKKSFIERARDLQTNLEARRDRIGKGKYGRVLKMARKPTNEEFSKSSKITGLGIVLIGGLGFLIFLIVELAAPWVARALGLIPPV